MSPQGWIESVLAQGVPSFNPSAKTCVHGTVTGTCPSKLQVVLITSFIMALKKVVCSVQVLLVAVCLSTQYCMHIVPGHISKKKL